MKITRQSPFTGRIQSMEIACTQEQLDRYDRGEVLLQQVFPHLPAEQREFIKTGITPQEWEEAFGDGD